MGNTAAEFPQEAATASELIAYYPTEIAPGIVINMQTMYMTWLTMAIVFLLFFLAAINPKMIPSGLQNVMEFFMDFLNGLMESVLGIHGRNYIASSVIILFMFLLISNSLGVVIP